MLLAAVDRRIGLIDRLTDAIIDTRHPSYITHPMRDLLTQRVFQIASGYEDGNDANALRRSDIYRMARALVLQFIAGYDCAPAAITLDLDHTDDATYGQQPLSFYNHHYGHPCYLPLLVFEAHSGALVTAVLRPGKRPTGPRTR